jgi:hypothetical protein
MSTTPKTAASPSAAGALPPLPPGWEATRDTAGNEYFYHVETQVSQWERPAPVAAGSLATRYAEAVAALTGRAVTSEVASFGKDFAEMASDAAAGGSHGYATEAALTAIGWSAGALQTAAPALLFAAPAALAVAAVLRQFTAMRANKEAAAELAETVVALRPVLRDVSRNDAVAGEHAHTLRAVTVRLTSAADLLARLGKQWRCTSFFFAGADGAALAAAGVALRDWLGLLTAAVTAGSEGRLRQDITSACDGVRADVAAMLADERATLVEAVRTGGGGAGSGVPVPALAPLPAPTADELAAWRDLVAGQLARLGLAATAAEQVAQHEAARGLERQRELLDWLRGEFASQTATLERAIAAAASEAADRDAATKAAVGGVARKVEDVGVDVAEVKALAATLRGEVAAAYAAARASGKSCTAAAEASYLAATRSAARLLLARVPSLPPERLLVWDDVCLGRGSFGVVHVVLLLPAAGAGASARPAVVAVKRLTVGGTAGGGGGGGGVPLDPASVARFAREVRLQAALTGRLPGVVGVHGLCERPAAGGGGGTETLLVAELMATSLHAALYGDDRRGEEPAELPLPDRLALLRDLAAVLAALHDGVGGVRVTHADVKAVSSDR